MTQKFIEIPGLKDYKIDVNNGNVYSFKSTTLLKNDGRPYKLKWIRKSGETYVTPYEKGLKYTLLKQYVRDLIHAEVSEMNQYIFSIVVGKKKENVLQAALLSGDKHLEVLEKLSAANPGKQIVCYKKICQSSNEVFTHIE